MTSSGKQRPPPLPPRNSSTDAPPPYSLVAMQSQDPRSSSTESLVPDPALEDTGRRRLLLVYIHGFMGNETSFRSFPAHVHNLVTITLAETHVVHTKIYPRYQSKHSLEIARDNFSRWYEPKAYTTRLAPHEDQWTDIILLGHSMGGLLAGDIALVFRHRILGVVNFDVPFLGMHPGIIKAGLGSIFSAPPAPQDAIVEDAGVGQRPSRMSTIFNLKPTDPNYNPAFPNDVHLPNRKGWENSVHWLTKHYKDGLKEATKGLVKSHLEFGSAMADYKELKNRYVKVRALEEDDERKRKTAHSQMPTVPRIRFVNYYTASTGRSKKPKSPASPPPTSPTQSRSASLQLQHQDSDTSVRQDLSQQPQFHEETGSTSTLSPEIELTHIHPDPIVDTPRVSLEAKQDDHVPASSETPRSMEAHASGDLQNGPPNLPEIPPIPQEPPFVDLMQFPDKASRKAAEKEHDQALKEYQKAVKARNKIINERTKMEERYEKDKAKEKKEQDKKEKKLQEQVEKVRKEREKEAKQRQDQVEKAQKEEENRTRDKEKHMSTEEKQRQKEREQRKAEAEQRDAEARQRQREADLRAGKIPAEDKPEPPPVVAQLEEDVGAMELGDSEPAHDSRSPYAHYEFSRSGIMSQSPPDSRAESTYTLSTMDSRNSHAKADASETQAKPKKLRKFCMLPPKDADGNKDPTWIRVFMENMDEVTAHTSLFFINETYERLVGDVSARIEDWVKEADSVRVVQEMQHAEQQEDYKSYDEKV
ncbi:catalytic [Pyrenophora seminiperda CCB06]|uniref:Catalytic n=1 Tax=Pyrenophora seminiperda CCB06 TaxID=1302712 RepID=A0A3M7M639_9PLEO|nr:catalytic [Pyrenophora seminiperda CCB06]